MTTSTAKTSLGSSNAIVTYHSDDECHVAINAQEDRAEIICRAMLAFLSNKNDRFNNWGVPSEVYSCTWTDETTGFVYVCLGTEWGRLLAVYRLDSRKKLKRLRRYPAAISARYITAEDWAAFQDDELSEMVDEAGAEPVTLNPHLLALIRSAGDAAHKRIIESGLDYRFGGKLRETT